MDRIGFEDFSAQGDEIRALREQIEEGRMVHALLISGEPGTGKRTLAGLLASALMCHEKTGVPCGQCSGCAMSFAGEHPDITIIEKGVPLSPETTKGRATIPVDDIREMIRICSQYAYEGGNRAVIIRDAENMTVQAQNSLLKILEEPPRDTYFLLTTSHPEQLLTTVKSRCRQVKLVPWETSWISDLLVREGTDPERASQAAAVSGGSIGNAKLLVSDETYWHAREEIINAFFRNRKRSDILTLSSGWKDRKGEADMLFGILEENVRALLKHRLNRDGERKPGGFPDEWIRFAEQAPLERFAFLSDSISEARKQNAYNVNFQAIIEQLLLTFTGESDKWQK